MINQVGQLILMAVIAYLLGSIPNGVWIGKTFFNVDIRKHGSGNIGTTNTYRVLGPKAGTIVMILDISKGAVATLLPTIFNNHTVNPLIFGICAIIGHTFSIFDGLKGGKAVATSAGMLLAYKPWLFLVAATLWGSLIFITSIVSLASMIAFSIITVITIFIKDYPLMILAIILTGFIFYRHRSNIKRILNGTESKVPFGLGNKIKQNKKDDF